MKKRIYIYILVLLGIITISVFSENKAQAALLRYVRLTCNKEWITDNIENIPEKITINLKVDDEIKYSAEMSADTGWHANFGYVQAEIREGEYIQYTIEEVLADGFTAVYYLDDILLDNPTVVFDDTSKDFARISIKNIEYKEFPITIKKLDADTNQLLAGAELKVRITDKNNMLLAEEIVITDDNGMAITNYKANNVGVFNVDIKEISFPKSYRKLTLFEAAKLQTNLQDNSFVRHPIPLLVGSQNFSDGYITAVSNIPFIMNILNETDVSLTIEEGKYRSSKPTDYTTSWYFYDYTLDKLYRDIGNIYYEVDKITGEKLNTVNDDFLYKPHYTIVVHDKTGYGQFFNDNQLTTIQLQDGFLYSIYYHARTGAILDWNVGDNDSLNVENRNITLYNKKIDTGWLKIKKTTHEYMHKFLFNELYLEQ